MSNSRPSASREPHRAASISCSTLSNELTGDRMRRPSSDVRGPTCVSAEHTQQARLSLGLRCPATISWKICANWFFWFLFPGRNLSFKYAKAQTRPRPVRARTEKEQHCGVYLARLKGLVRQGLTGCSHTLWPKGTPSLREVKRIHENRTKPTRTSR